MQVGCTLIEMQPEQFSRKGKSAQLYGKTNFHIIADMASAMLCNGSVECLIPPLRRGLCNYFSTAQGATAFQEYEPLRNQVQMRAEPSWAMPNAALIAATPNPTAMGFRQNSVHCEIEAGSGRLARCRLLRPDIIREMVAPGNGENIPIECNVLTDCLTATIAAAESVDLSATNEVGLFVADRSAPRCRATPRLLKAKTTYLLRQMRKNRDIIQKIKVWSERNGVNLHYLLILMGNFK